MTRPEPDTVLQTEDVRVRVMPLGQGEIVPWHTHSVVTDHMFCLSGRICVRAAEPEEEFVLGPGQRCTIRPGRPHRVENLGEAAEYLLVQGVGRYDFKRLEDFSPA